MRIFRFKQLYGPEGLFGIGRSKFFEDYIRRNGTDSKIPGTSIDRLKVLRLGARARGVADSEVTRVIEELKTGTDHARRRRDA